MDWQELADTPLTRRPCLLWTPGKAFPTGISSFILKLLAAAFLEVCSLPRANYGQQQGVLSSVPSSSNPPQIFRMTARVYVSHQLSLAVGSILPLLFLPRAPGNQFGGREFAWGLHAMTLVPLAVSPRLLLLAQSVRIGSLSTLAHLFCLSGPS